MLRFALIATAIVTSTSACSWSQTEGPRLPDTDKGVLPAPKLLPDGKALEKLKEERKGLSKDRETPSRDDDESSSDAEKRALRKRIELILDRMAQKAASPPKSVDPKTAKSDPPIPKVEPRLVPELNQKDNDLVARAVNLYRDGQYEAAYQAFKIIDTLTLGRDDRLFVQYMTACAVRRTNKLGEAAALFREITDKKEDEFITECAIWQLSSIRWRLDMEIVISDMRQKREAATPK